MGTLLEAMLQFFQEDKWPFTLREGSSLIDTAFQGDSGKWSCIAQARESQQQFVFYSLCPVNVPEAKRQQMAEFLTRANYGLINGNFEMNFEDGSIRYKTSVDVEGDRLSTALTQRVVYANVLTMDQYLPGIMSIIYANASPAEEIARLEIAGTDE